jgi:hypothetical protein
MNIYDDDFDVNRMWLVLFCLFYFEDKWLKVIFLSIEKNVENVA